VVQNVVKSNRCWALTKIIDGSPSQGLTMDSRSCLTHRLNKTYFTQKFTAPSQPDSWDGIQLIPSHVVDRWDEVEYPSIQVYCTAEPWTAR